MKAVADTLAVVASQWQACAADHAGQQTDARTAYRSPARAGFPLAFRCRFMRRRIRRYP